MKLEQAARQALEALEVSTDWDVGAKGKQLQSMKAITALREALAEQTEQEPVAWMVTMENQDGTRKTFPLSGRYKDVRDTCDFGDPIPLYAAPVRTKDLTDDEIAKVLDSLPMTATNEEIIRAVIAADREKNRGTA